MSQKAAPDRTRWISKFSDSDSTLLTNLRLSSSAASGPGIVIVILDDEATLYFLTNGLHNLIFTNISKIVFANTLMTGDIGGGKKLKDNQNLISNESFRVYLANENDADISPVVPF
jgi:hypothetical protein